MQGPLGCEQVIFVSILTQTLYITAINTVLAVWTHQPTKTESDTNKIKSWYLDLGSNFNSNFSTSTVASDRYMTRGTHV